MPLIIKVTYGTRENQVYATVPDLPDGRPDQRTARLLERGAKERGYTDAKIVDEKVFREAQDPHRRHQGGSRGAYRRAG